MDTLEKEIKEHINNINLYTNKLNISKDVNELLIINNNINIKNLFIESL